MQRLSDSAAWVRFASALLGATELRASEIAREADEMLRQYQRRFPVRKASIPKDEAPET